MKWLFLVFLGICMISLAKADIMYINSGGSSSNDILRIGWGDWIFTDSPEQPSSSIPPGIGSGSSSGGGLPINLYKIDIDYNKRWQINQSQVIDLKIYNITNGLIDVPKVEIYFNESIEYNLIRKNIGIYKINTEIISKELLDKNILFNITVEENGKIISKVREVVVVDETPSEKIINDIKGTTQSYFSKVTSYIEEHIILTMILILIFILIIVSIIMAKSKKRLMNKFVKVSKY